MRILTYFIPSDNGYILFYLLEKQNIACFWFFSAVIASRTLKEREEQVKFLAELKRQAAEKVRQDDMETIKKGKEWEQHVANQKRRRREENKKHQKEILEQ